MYRAARLALILSLVVTFPSLLVAADGIKSDGERLQGKWGCVAVEEAGETLPAEYAKISWLAFRDKEFEWGDVPQLKPEHGSFILDETRNPKTIDLKYDRDGPTIRAIYDLKADTLRICWFADRISKRPAKIKTGIGSPCTVMTLKRAKN